MSNVRNMQSTGGDNRLAWERLGKYHSTTTDGLYTVAAYRTGDKLLYRASRARIFLGGPVETPEEAKAICQNNFSIMGPEK